MNNYVRGQWNFILTWISLWPTTYNDTILLFQYWLAWFLSNCHEEISMEASSCKAKFNKAKIQIKVILLNTKLPNTVKLYNCTIIVPVKFFNLALLMPLKWNAPDQLTALTWGSGSTTLGSSHSGPPFITICSRNHTKLMNAHNVQATTKHPRIQSENKFSLQDKNINHN